MLFFSLSILYSHLRSHANDGWQGWWRLCRVMCYLWGLGGLHQLWRWWDFSLCKDQQTPAPWVLYDCQFSSFQSDEIQSYYRMSTEIAQNNRPDNNSCIPPRCHAPVLSYYSCVCVCVCTVIKNRGIINEQLMVVTTSIGSSKASHHISTLSWLQSWIQIPLSSSYNSK